MGWGGIFHNVTFAVYFHFLYLNSVSLFFCNNNLIQALIDLWNYGNLIIKILNLIMLLLTYPTYSSWSTCMCFFIFKQMSKLIAHNLRSQCMHNHNNKEQISLVADWYHFTDCSAYQVSEVIFVLYFILLAWRYQTSDNVWISITVEQWF